MGVFCSVFIPTCSQFFWTAAAGPFKVAANIAVPAEDHPVFEDADHGFGLLRRPIVGEDYALGSQGNQGAQQEVFMPELLPFLFAQHLPEVLLFQGLFLFVQEKKLFRAEKKHMDLVNPRFLDFHKILEEFDEFLVFFVRQEIVDYFLKALFQFEEIIFQPEPQKAFQKNTVIFPEKILDFLLNPGQAPLSPGFIQGGNNMVAEEQGFFLGKVRIVYAGHPVDKILGNVPQKQRADDRRNGGAESFFRFLPVLSRGVIEDTGNKGITPQLVVFYINKIPVLFDP